MNSWRLSRMERETPFYHSTLCYAPLFSTLPISENLISRFLRHMWSYPWEQRRHAAPQPSLHPWILSMQSCLARGGKLPSMRQGFLLWGHDALIITKITIIMMTWPWSNSLKLCKSRSNRPTRTNGSKIMWLVLMIRDGFKGKLWYYPLYSQHGESSLPKWILPS